MRGLRHRSFSFCCNAVGVGAASNCVGTCGASGVFSPVFWLCLSAPHSQLSWPNKSTASSCAHAWVLLLLLLLNYPDTSLPHVPARPGPTVLSAEPSADILESIFATPSTETPPAPGSAAAQHSGHHALFAHSASLPAIPGSQQQQHLMDRILAAGGAGVGGGGGALLMSDQGMESLVSLAAKQAAKEEELASLRSQVCLGVCVGCVMHDGECCV